MRNYWKIIKMNWHGKNIFAFQFNSIQFWNKIIELNWFSKKIVFELRASIQCMTLNRQRLAGCMKQILIWNKKNLKELFFIGEVQYFSPFGRVFVFVWSQYDGGNIDKNNGWGSLQNLMKPSWILWGGD